MRRDLLLLPLIALLVTGRGSGAQRFETSTLLCHAGRTASVALGDLDGDGDLDLVLGNGRHDPEPNFVYLNDGRGNFYGRRALDEEPDRTYRVALGDVDRDGDLDIVLGNRGAQSVAYLNDGAARFGNSRPLGIAKSQVYAVALADMDLDGDLDAVVATWASRSSFVDSDGDGKPDRWLETKRDEIARVMLNDGTARFTEGDVFGAGGDRMRALAVGDIDKDGDNDIVVANDCQSSAVYYNTVRSPGVPAQSPLGLRVDHIMFLPRDPASLVALLTDTLGLPLVWPTSPNSRDNSCWSSSSRISMTRGTPAAPPTASP